MICSPVFIKSHLNDVITKLVASKNKILIFKTMECSVEVDTIKSGWSIVYLEGLHVNISKKIESFFSLMIDFVLTNSVVP